MSAKVVLTTFTDPMMGLSWEQEPVYRKLEARFGDQLEFRYRMVPLVTDVMRLVDPRDLQYGEAEAIRRYNKRLSRIYLDEEPIGGVPIVMDGFSLFSTEERSTIGLCLAWEAANIVSPEVSEAYLYALRYATVVEGRRTVCVDVALDVARECGLDVDAVELAIRDGRARVALDENRTIAARLGIHALPAVLVSCDGSAVLLNGLAPYDAFAASIGQTSGSVASQCSEFKCSDHLLDMMRAHPLISAQEIVSAFGLGNEGEAKSLVVPLVEDGSVTIAHIKDSWFARAVARL